MGLKRFTANARLLCGTATGLALMATAAPAAAQDNEGNADVADDQGNQIVVTGIRSAIENSLETNLIMRP